MYVVKKKHLEIDICTNYHSITFGISVGVNRFVKKKVANFYVELFFLFWTFGIEVMWR